MFRDPAIDLMLRNVDVGSLKKFLVGLDWQNPKTIIAPTPSQQSNVGGNNENETPQEKEQSGPVSSSSKPTASEADHGNGISKKLQNCTGSFKKLEAANIRRTLKTATSILKVKRKS